MGTWRNSGHRYGRVAQSLHWMVAAMVFTQAAVGLYVDDLPLGIERIKWMSWHKSLGITILALVLLRLGWRAFDSAPAMPSRLPQWQRRLAWITHAAMYLLLLLAPIAGWLAASAAGLGISWFGFFVVPPLMEKTPALADGFEQLHNILVYGLAALVFLHVAAVVYHAMRREGILSRMLPDFLRAGNSLPGNSPEERV